MTRQTRHPTRRATRATTRATGQPAGSAARQLCRRGPLFWRAGRELEALDLAMYQAVAATPTPTLDPVLGTLSRTADNSVLWMSVAAALAARRGAPRRAAGLGLASVAVASTTVNLLAKRLLPRARPDRAGADVPASRRARMPTSGSFPSGHAASAFAFASAAGGELPAAALPLHLLAAAVAWSRVHTGVHFPSDAVIGAVAGAAAGALTRRAAPPLAHRLARRGAAAPPCAPR